MPHSDGLRRQEPDVEGEHPQDAGKVPGRRRQPQAGARPPGRERFSSVFLKCFSIHRTKFHVSSVNGRAPQWPGHPPRAGARRRPVLLLHPAPPSSSRPPLPVKALTAACPNGFSKRLLAPGLPGLRREHSLCSSHGQPPMAMAPINLPLASGLPGLRREQRRADLDGRVPPGHPGAGAQPQRDGARR